MSRRTGIALIAAMAALAVNAPTAGAGGSSLLQLCQGASCNPPAVVPVGTGGVGPGSIGVGVAVADDGPARGSR